MTETVEPGATVDMLVGLNRSVTTARLLSGAIHEVNNALQVISGTVEILETRSDLPRPVVEALDRLRTHSRRAATALSDVMVFTKGQRAARGPVNLRELVAHSLGLRAYAMRRARLTVTFDPDPTARFIVLANQVDLQQAVLNVLINAEQAMSQTPGTIAVTLERTDDRVTLRIRDAGTGVQLDGDPFAAWSSTKLASESAGLGLWAAKMLVEEYGGTIAFEPVDGGACVVITLPAS